MEITTVYRKVVPVISTEDVEERIKVNNVIVSVSYYRDREHKETVYVVMVCPIHREIEDNSRWAVDTGNPFDAYRREVEWAPRASKKAEKVAMEMAFHTLKAMKQYKSHHVHEISDDDFDSLLKEIYGGE